MIIKKIFNRFLTMITDKKYRLAVISAACFFASFALTATLVKTVKVIGMRKSVGGFETSSLPEYTENLEAQGTRVLSRMEMFRGPIVTSILSRFPV